MRYPCETSAKRVLEVVVKHLRISNSETEDFVDCVKDAITENRIVKPYNELKDALIFSFDAELNAFSNFSKGWHKERRRRPYFERGTTLIEELEAMMITARPSGGRVFIDNDYAYFFDRDSDRTNLCSLEWPNGRNVVDEIHSYWFEQRRSASRSSFTVAKVFRVGQR